MILPGSWSAVLEPLRPAFRRRRTFTLFTVLATGMVAQTGRRSVVGMLAGARMAGAISFHAACRFFSQAVWDADRLGLLVARLIADRLLDPGAPVVVVADDTLFRRWGRKVHHAFWTHDGAAQGKRKIGRGNRWVIAGIAVSLPFCSSPVCLPVLFRLWAGKGTASPVELAGELMARIAAEFPGRPVHGSATRPTTAGRCWYPARPGQRDRRPTPPCSPWPHPGRASVAGRLSRAPGSASRRIWQRA
jgi:DDE superfamily endonuclease